MTNRCVHRPLKMLSLATSALLLLLSIPETALSLSDHPRTSMRQSTWTLLEQATQPAPGEPGLSRIAGEPIPDGDVRAMAIDVCRVVLPDAGSGFQVLLSRDDAFADALAGSALANFDSCVLFTGGGPDEALDPRVRAEIDRVLPPGGQVSLLGGTQAVSRVTEGELVAAGYAVDRFSGPTRYETAVQIARVAQALAHGSEFIEVLLAYGENWPDALTAGAYAAALGVPIVLTPTERLHPATAEFLRGGPAVDRTGVIGGTAVISEQVASAAPNAVRFAGPNRMGTAAELARALWPDVPLSGEDFLFVNLEHPQGWAFALAATPLSAKLSAPQLGVAAERYPAETSAYLRGRRFTELPSAVLLGDVGFISDAVARRVEDDIQPDGSTTQASAASELP